MKSYLSLIPISAKVRHRQSRMTILCIVLAVLLVTTIFSLADMMIRTESQNMQEEHGSWHIQLVNISSEIAEEISERQDVTAIGWSENYNFNADEPYYIEEKKAALYGTDSSYMTQLFHSVDEGTFPQKDDEIMLSSNARLALNVEVGDYVTVYTPAGNAEFMISGFGSDDKSYYQGQSYLIAVYMTQTAFETIMDINHISSNPTCYVQFQNASKASKAISEIQQQYHLPEDSISENTAIMGLSGQSNSTYIKSMYGMAVCLFILVLLAGVLMISGSINSNVAQRTKFFGMMRCVGASRQQIIRFVRLEALNWCKTSVPIGLIIGTAISWGICAILHYGIGGEFATTPVFTLSPVGLISGIVVGIVTVLLAAQAPAKRAARVSPMSAVSGNLESGASASRTFRHSFGRIEKMLGIHHAIASKKNWFMMTASFSLSIILFLCFWVGLNFAHGLIPSLRSWQPDILLNGYANARVLSPELGDTLSEITGVGCVFGSSYMENVPATSSRQGIDHVNLVSYSDYLIDSATDSLVQGDLSAVYGNSNQVITISDKDNPLKVGDTIQIAGQEVEIVCAISSGVWPSEYSVICSEETFEQLTGERNYSLIGVQLEKDATDETIQQINSLVENDVIFSDLRETNRQDYATYLATGLVMYSFLAIIAMITLFYILNSISMSVLARTKQYGAMRAVGMDSRQLTWMIAAEAFTYTISGLLTGGAIGIPVSRYLFIKLLTRYFGQEWSFPVILVCIIIVFGLGSAAIAVYAPSKRMRNMAITDIIHER